MIARPPSVVILAGGAGRRLGGDKPFHVFEGRPLISAAIATLQVQTRKLFINAGPRNRPHGGLAGTGIELCFDDPRFENLGPLTGIHAALQKISGLGADRVITAPCDMPRLPADMVARLIAGHDDSNDVTYFQGVRDYPLCALWSARLLPHLEQALEAARAAGGLAVMAYLQTCTVGAIRVTDDVAFTNVNRPTPPFS